MSKETFKIFVKKNPNLADFVTKGDMTWQGFYEMFDLYGESSSVWDKYLNNNSSLLGDTSLKDIFNAVKKIDLDTVKKGVNGLQKAVDLAQDIVTTRTANNTIKTPAYQRRPIYKYFED